MRLWSLHPKYLDARGLVALWREALLARKVLDGKTKGYKYHPQLERFKQQQNPMAAINTYLLAVYKEALARGYSFDQRKIGRQFMKGTIPVTSGQFLYELEHFKNKLYKRDRKKYFEIMKIRTTNPHPIFSIVSGKVETWEKI